MKVGELGRGYSPSLGALAPVEMDENDGYPEEYVAAIDLEQAQPEEILAMVRRGRFRANGKGTGKGKGKGKSSSGTHPEYRCGSCGEKGHAGPTCKKAFVPYDKRPCHNGGKPGHIS